jgi:hypothetical protein
MYYSSTSPLSVMFFQSNLIAVKLIRRKPCRLWIYYIVHWFSFFVFWFIFTTLHAYLGKAFCFCPVHPSVCSAVTKVCTHNSSYIFKQNSVKLCMLVYYVWRIITACRLDNFRRSYCPLTKNISLKKEYVFII